MAACGVMPATFMEALASSIRKDANGDTFLNVICFDNDCGDQDPAIGCGEGLNDPEAFVVANAFGVDSCGNMAIKLRVCVVADAEQR